MDPLETMASPKQESSHVETRAKTKASVDERKVWIKYGAEKAKQLPYGRDDVIKTMYGSRGDTIAELNGSTLLPNEFLHNYASDTTEDSPLYMYTSGCVVWVNRNKRVQAYMYYEHSNQLVCLYNPAVEVIMFEDGIQNGRDFIREYSTTRKNPLYIKQISKYLQLPYTASVDLLNCETLSELMDRLKLSHENDEYVATSLGKYIDSDVTLFDVFKEGNCCISKISDNLCQYSLATCASIASRTKEEREKIMSQTTEYPLFAHHLAMGVHSYVPSGDTQLSKLVQKILNEDNYSSELRLQEKIEEKTYTNLLSMAFGNFLQPKHCCLHQCAVHGGSIPDFYVASLQDSFPQCPKLVGDFNISKMDDAVAQSFHYCMSIVMKDARPMFIMPCTAKKFQLILCIPGQKNLAYIKIKEANVAKETELALFFDTVKYGVNCLDPSLLANDPFEFGFRPTPSLFLPLTNRCNKRVYIWDNRVYKFFEGNDYGLPNIEIMKSCLGENYLANMELTPLTEDGHFQMFTYDYLEEEEYLQIGPECFKGVAKALDLLHSKGIVHSDVRLANMVFLRGGSSKLIDYDLADKVNTKYPGNYNEHFYVRHPDAKPDQPRETIHDRYSFFLVMRCTVKKTHWNAINGFIKENRTETLENLCTSLQRLRPYS